MPMVTSMALLTTLLTTIQKLPVTRVQTGMFLFHMEKKTGETSGAYDTTQPTHFTGPSITSSNGGILDRSNRPHQRSCTSDH